MAVYGTERDILNAVGRLEEASVVDIQRKIGFSPHYVDYLCKYLVRKDYLTFSKDRRYSLTKSGKKFLMPPNNEKAMINEGLVKEIAGRVAKEVSEQIEHKVRGVSIPLEKKEEKVKIRTDFNYPVEDKSLGLETNINKLGAGAEKELSDIDGAVKSLRNIIKTRDRKEDERRKKRKS